MDIQGPEQLFHNYTRIRRHTINTPFTRFLLSRGRVVNKAALLSEGHEFNPCNSQSAINYCVLSWSVLHSDIAHLSAYYFLIALRWIFFFFLR